mmetsp:Transcript_86552/g.193551  ORF Transcript_86552/g.193551 Transcript_86552/m.193551 type:complete len:239 (-) Transcript_86552:18-734(-)
MGCGSSRPQAAVLILGLPGCEWTERFASEIREIAPIVRGWSHDGDGAKWLQAYKEKVLKGDLLDNGVAAASQGSMVAAQMGAALGGLFGAAAGAAASDSRRGTSQGQAELAQAANALGSLGAAFGGAMGALVGAASGGLQANQAHSLASKVFGSSKVEAKKLAEQTLARGCIVEVYSQNPVTGDIIMTERKEKLTGQDFDQLFRERVRSLTAQQQSGADKLALLELVSLCLAIEVLRL